MSIFTSLKHLSPCRLILSLALSAPAITEAATIQAGDVTTALGPAFFVDDAANGGSDTDINQPNVAAFNRLFNGLLTRDQGPTRIHLTGLGFATHTSAAANDATSVAVTFTYLGADELLGGGDDVVIGTATGAFVFTSSALNPGAEYVFAFDSPLSADLTITGTRFRIQIAPSNASNNGSLKLKTAALASEPALNSAKLSVAGLASSLINPQRWNLAKFQPVTTGSVTGQRLASYVTDGVTGNDNRWQGESWAYNYARVDFPFPVEVGSAQVFTGVDDTFPIGNFNIQYLNGSTWVTIPGGSASGNTDVESNLVFTNPVTASSFRLLGQDGNLRIRELALYPPNGPTGFPLGTDVTINLAYQRPAVASTSTAGNFALNAVDGRASGTMWQTDTAGTNTLDIDLRVSTKIGSAHVYSGATGVSPLADFVLKFWDGTAWQNIPGGTVIGNTTSDLVVSFTPVTTSQVRLEFTNPGSTSIRELCVFPANTGNTGYPIGTNIIGSGSIAKYETYHDAFYQINSNTSSRFMAVPNDGQPSLDQSGLTTGQGHYQVLLNLSNGTYRLRNRATGNCLSGAQLSKTPGLPLTDAPYSALPHQDWILDPLGGGVFQIINAWSGLVIDTEGASSSAGTALVQNTANQSPTQRWQFSYFAGYPKKGIGGTTFAMATHPDWTYNWSRTNSQTIPEDASFYPMQWGNFSWDIGSSQGPIRQEYPSWRRRADGIHLLGFNEPDGADQSNIPVNTAITLWPRLQEMDMPLVSPAPASMSNGWLASFFTQAGSLGYRVDYTAVHTYPSPSGGSSDNLINFIQDAYNNWDRPVWLTEFSFVDWGKNQSWSEEDNYNCLAEFLWRAESLPALRKYALFVYTENAEYPQPANAWQSITPAPRSNTYDISGNLTAFGKLYAAWDRDAEVRPNKTYHIHHKLSRKRIANLTTQSNLSGRNIRVDGALVNWTLVSAGASNRYHLVSSLDGRRLSTDGTSVSLVAPGTTGTAVEWSLTENQHGWHYLGHPATSKRLKLVYNNSNFVSTYSMVATTSTGDDVQWRFIVPLVNNTAPVLAAIPPQTVNEGTLLTFTASATDDNLPANNLTYSLIGAPGGASMDAGTGVFTWTPSEAQGPGMFNFTVRVSDGNLTHDQPVTVSVIEAGSSEVFETWIVAGQSNAEGYGITESPISGLAPNSTLSSIERGDLNVTHNNIRMFQGANDSNGITSSAGLALPARNTWHAMTSCEGLAFDWGSGRGNESGRRFGPELAFGYDVQRQLGSSIALIKYARGSSSIAPSTAQSGGVWRDFDPSDGGRLNQYDKLVSTIQAAVDSLPAGQVLKLRGVVWMQGESDATVTAASSYQANLTELIAALRTDIGAIAAASGGRMTRSAASWSELDVFVGTVRNTTAYRQTVIDAQNAVAAADANVFTVNGTTGLSVMTTDDWGDSGVHYDTAGQVLLGERFADAAISRLDSGVLVSESGGTTSVSEGGSTDHYTVTLTRAPSADVTISIATDSQVSVSPDSLTFTASDWSTPQTVTVTAVNDTVNESNHTGVIDHGLSSLDLSYGGLPITGVTAAVIDNDVLPPLPGSQVDSDGDGLSDLLEYAFLTDPGIPNGNPFRVIAANAGAITLEFPWNWQAAGLSWRIRHGHDLSNIAAWPVIAPGTTTVTREGNIDRIAVAPARDYPERGFYVLEVIGN